MAHWPDWRGRHVEEVVAYPVQQLHTISDLPVVLYEEAVEGGIVGHREVAEVLAERRVAERIRSAARRQVAVDRRECVFEPFAAHAVVGDELRIDAGLEAVRPANERHVVDDLPDSLI